MLADTTWLQSFPAWMLRKAVVREPVGQRRHHRRQHQLHSVLQGRMGDGLHC